jgi:hypothetical protein
MKIIFASIMVLIATRAAFAAGPMKCEGQNIRIYVDAQEKKITYYISNSRYADENGPGSNLIIKKQSETGDVDMTYLTNDRNVSLTVDDQYGDVFHFGNQNIPVKCSR